MFKDNKKEKAFIELISSLFNEDDIRNFFKKLKEDDKKEREILKKEVKEMLNVAIKEIDKVKGIKSYLYLVNLGEQTVSSYSGRGYNIIESVEAACSSIKNKNEKEKITLWKGITHTILKVLGEDNG